MLNLPAGRKVLYVIVYKKEVRYLSFTIHDSRFTFFTLFTFMQNIDSYTHLRGESIYVDDIPLIEGTLYGAVFDSPVAHGLIVNLYMEAALQTHGVVRIFTSKDIPGINQIGGIVQDEPLLANDKVDFCGMPIAFVVATSEEAARTALKKIRVEIEALPVITDP